MYLVERTNGSLDFFRLAYGLILSMVVRRITGRRMCLRVRFKDFRLSWMAASGELTPFMEVEELFTKGLLRGQDGTGWVVVDCGANIGLFSVFLKRCEQLIAVEPNPTCHKMLKRNLSDNVINGITINKAVSDRPGWVCMNLNPESTVLGKIEDGGNSQVEATTIDQIINEFGLNRVDLLKLDLEGHEPEALEGTRKSLENGTIHRIYSEFNSPEMLEKLDSILLPFDYSRIGTSGYNALYRHARCISNQNP